MYVQEQDSSLAPADEMFFLTISKVRQQGGYCPPLPVNDDF